MITVNQMYSDISPALDRAWDNDFKKVVGVGAVKNSMLMIVTTRRGSRPFNPNFGCDLHASLFENMNPLTIDTISKNISDAIRNYEPRVKTLTVDVTPLYDDNEVIVTIYFSIIDNPDELDQLKFKLSKK